MSGFRVFSCEMRYIEKQPGKQVTLPNKLSKALDMLCEIQYSYTCIYNQNKFQGYCTIVIIECFELVRAVSPQSPITDVSCMKLATILEQASGATSVSASIMNKNS
jgi:hypothetical protein